MVTVVALYVSCFDVGFIMCIHIMIGLVDVLSVHLLRTSSFLLYATYFGL